jgi:hypothetical protein
VLVERHDPRWLQTATAGLLQDVGPMKLHVESAERIGDLIAMSLRYSDRADSWLHSFVTAPLLEEEIERMLSGCGFEHFMWRGATRRWVAAWAGSDGAL